MEALLNETLIEVLQNTKAAARTESPRLRPADDVHELTLIPERCDSHMLSGLQSGQYKRDASTLTCTVWTRTRRVILLSLQSDRNAAAF